jgi:antitoxin component YwqK of YwqJK toxin-antitoxin module
MKTILLYVLILVPLFTSAQPAWPPVGKAGTDYNVNNAKSQKQGLWYRTYAEGGLYYAGYFQDGKPQAGSTMWYFYQGGQLMAVHTFRSNIDIVDAVTYFKNGALQSRGKYLQQKKDSTWEFYTESGYLTSREDFAKDMRNGNVLIFYPDGRVMHEGKYTDDKLNGSVKEYFPDGTPKLQGSCVNDMYDGKVVQYQKNGLKLSEGSYAAGVKQGEWLFYLENGKLQMQVLYDKGKSKKEVRHNGDFIDYYDSGIPSLEITYRDGEKHGIFTEYYDQGEWIKEQKPAEEPGSPIEWTEKLVKRQIKVQGEYKMGKMVGDVVYFGEEGRLLKTETYENGVLTETK